MEFWAEAARGLVCASVSLGPNTAVGASRGWPAGGDTLQNRDVALAKATLVRPIPEYLVGDHRCTSKHSQDQKGVNPTS